jgi:iron-sulfur cluster repair protein YtfE (RIC family)
VPDDANAPADTNMMRIVHSALRRDLQRARVSLTSVPPPDDRQRVAIAEHLEWMMRFLEAHHRSEDVGLYPLVRERDPGAAPLLDEMAKDHEAIAPAVVQLERTAATLVETDEPDALICALDDLTDVLLPHLQREEDEVMPVVSGVITNAEWRDLEQRHNLDGKSMAQLGREGHWLIDGATGEDRARVLGLVPRVPRLLLLHGFGPSYRRHASACWSPRHRRVQHQGSTAVVVDADIEAVWDVVRDPTRVGEWSHECVDGKWVGDAAEARPGARFRGRNKQGMVRWGRLCEVVSAEPYELVWRTVPTKLYPDSTEWAIRLARIDGGTTIEQTFQVVKGSKLEPVYATVLPAHRDRTEALKQDLERIGAVAIEASRTQLPAA